MKIWTIAWKDTTIRFRDRNALILMIAAPLVLSAIIGSAFGSFLNGSDPAPISAIPVLLVNQDDGELGQQFADILTSDALGDLLLVTEMDDETAARDQVQRGEARAAIVIPDGFSEAVSGDSETAASPVSGVMAAMSRGSSGKKATEGRGTPWNLYPSSTMLM